MPRAFRASAIWWSDVAPARRISRITGSTLAAQAAARALFLAAARLRELRATPRALAVR
jgi:hypothetical protein